MQSQPFGDPQVGNRPGCWGRTDVYDSDSRECRGCGFQSTCRNQVIKSTPAQAVAPVNQPYYSQYTAPALPYMAPQLAQAPIQVARYQAPAPAPIAPMYTTPAPAPVRVQAQVPTLSHQQMQPGQPQQDWYGRMQDPLFFQILSPPPFRPQMHGENFGERLFKNLMLDLASMAMGHLMLGLRQMVLPPQPPDFK